jgi:hypothetical protein
MRAIEGYDDQPDAFYSWDDTVAHHSEIRPGDFIAIWDKVALMSAFPLWRRWSEDREQNGEKVSELRP